MVLLTGCQVPTQPDPPTNGPGAPRMDHAAWRTISAGEGATRVHIYEPADPAPHTAPVIVLLHGYGAVNAKAYGAWIRHLVQRGAIVIFPVYQDTLVLPLLYTQNALTGVQTAFGILNEGDHVRPDPTRFAIIGHSLGCVIGMNLAAIARESALPPVRAVLAANPGDGSGVQASLPTLQADNYAQIPADMLFLAVVGEADQVVRATTALNLYLAVEHLPAENREVLEFFTDAHGFPNILAGHGAPLADDDAFDTGEDLTSGPFNPAEYGLVNAMDYYGYWKLADGLFDAAFYGTNRQYALGATPEQAYMGTWSDGRPVNPALRVLPGEGLIGFLEEVAKGQ